MGTVNGHHENETMLMMEKPITDLSRLIGQKWFGSAEGLAERAGISVAIVERAVEGEIIRPWNEAKIRKVLEEL